MKPQLIELENERANHQKLIKDYARLEQRFEKVRTELLRYSKNNLISGSLSSSTTSFNNQHVSELESLIEELEQDSKQKLSSVSVTTNSSDINNAVNNFEANKLLYMTVNGSEMDVGLISKLNRRIAALELERKEFMKNGCLNNGLAEHDNNNNHNDLLREHQNHSPVSQIERLQYEKDYEIIKSQELELENQKLREDISRLRDLVADNQSGKMDTIINKEMINQFDALNEEVQRKREECIQLKSLLVSRHNMNKLNCTQDHDHMNGMTQNEMDIGDISSINTDGNEFEVGYNTQKILNRILENQMNEMKRNSESEKLALLKEMKSLKDENERQQNLLMQNLPPESLAEATYKNEIIKLADQNLELSEKCDKYAEEVKKYKKMLKVYIKRSRTSNLYLFVVAA